MRNYRATALVLGSLVALQGCASEPSTRWDEAYAELSLDTVQETAQRAADCLEEAGFPGVTATWDGGVVSPVIPDDQVEAFKAARKTCNDQVFGASDRMISDESKTQLYHLQVASSKCLEGEGYPAGSVPTLQTYLDSFGTATQWSAVSALPVETISEADYKKIARECPDPGWFVDLPTATN